MLTPQEQGGVGTLLGAEEVGDLLSYTTGLPLTRPFHKVVPDSCVVPLLS